MRQPLASGGVAKVIASDSSDHKEGDIITLGMMDWATHQLLKPGGSGLGSSGRVDPSAGLPLSYYTGIMGEPRKQALHCCSCFIIQHSLQGLQHTCKHCRREFLLRGSLQACGGSCLAGSCAGDCPLW